MTQTESVVAALARVIDPEAFQTDDDRHLRARGRALRKARARLPEITALLLDEQHVRLLQMQAAVMLIGEWAAGDRERFMIPRTTIRGAAEEVERQAADQVRPDSPT